MKSHSPLPPGLSVERRGRRLYLYARVRVGGRLHARYVGPIAPADAAALQLRARREREDRREAARVGRLRAAAVLAAGAGLDRLADQVTRAAMAAGGFRQHHRGEWRRRQEAAVPHEPDPGPAPLARPGRPPRPPHVPVHARDPGLADLVARAARGDRTAVPEVRAFLADPVRARTFGDVAAHARLALVDRVAGDHLLVAEAVTLQLAAVEAGFLADCGPDPTAAERVAAGRAAHAWATVHHLEVLLCREPAGTPGRAAVEADVGRADRRLQAALRGLAALRRLRGPAVRVTQVNVTGAERVVVG